MGGSAGSSRGARAGGRLFEREAQLDAFDALLSGAVRGEGGLTLLEAPAGLGKSSLLAAVRTSATDLGMEVLHAGGHVLADDYPFALTRRLFDRRLAAADEEERDELLSGAAAGARIVFDPPVAPGETEAAAEERLFPILHGLVWLTSNLADRHPVLLAVDDLHWADPPSLRFLLYLSGQLRDLPVAVIATARPAEPDAPQELLAQLRAQGATDCHSLAPLTSTGVRQLVQARLPAATTAFCDACVRATGGNPFLLSELLANVEQRDLTPDAEAIPAVEEAPTSVHDRVLARLWRLGPDAIAIARAVAVLDDDAEVRHAAALAEIGPDRAASVCGSLASIQILDDAAAPLRFVHPLVGSAVRDDIPSAELGAAHRRAARLLAEDRAPTERVAAHLLHADRRGDRWCVEQLRAAARQAVGQGGADAAVRLLRRALAEPPPPDARPSVLVELGEAEGLAADQQPVGRFEEALGLVENGRERARILLRLGRVLHNAGRMAEASEALKQGMAEVGDDDDELLEDLKGVFLATAWLDAAHAGDVEAYRDEFVRLRRHGHARTHRAVLAQETMHRLFAAEDHGQVIDSAMGLYDDGALLEEEGPGSLHLWIVVGCLSWADALPAAESIIDVALAAARAQGAVNASAHALYARSWPRYWRGQLSDAIADGQAAVSAWSAVGANGMYLPAAQYWLAVALVERGEVDAAADALELRDADERWGSTAMYLLWRIGQAHVASARGDWDAALDQLGTVADTLSESFPWIVNPALLPWRSSMALAARQVGDGELARRCAGEELELARRFGAPRSVGVALRTIGMVEGGEQGLEHLQEAVTVLERSPSALELCRSLIELGAAQRRLGYRAQARRPLRRGLDLANRFQGSALLHRAEEELRATGARPRRRALTGPDALTPAERRTAELAGQGMSNREIAQSLFVTVKTVEWHLHNAYAKLQIDSRDDLQLVLRNR